MKKFLVFLCIITMTFSLAACGVAKEDDNADSGNGSSGSSQNESGSGSGNGEDGDKDKGGSEDDDGDKGSKNDTNPPDKGGYDAEYELFVNGEESWTPFPSEKSVSFKVSDESILSLRPSDSKVEFTGKEVGETIITATCEGKSAKAYVKVKEMKIVIDYHYNPPTDNYCIEVKNSENGSSYSNKYAKIGNEEAMIDESAEWQEFHDVSTGAYYTVVEKKWYEDSRWGFYSFEESGHGSPICDFNDFVKQLGQLGFGNEKLPEFYVGEETICDVDCWVFDTNGWNEIYAKFWVDKENGCTLKKAGTTSDMVYEVIRYDLSYTEWDSYYLPK